MGNLTLGAISLAQKDVAYIRALVRLFAHTQKLSWVFAEYPPYDAVVTDRAGRAADPAFFAGFEGAVLTLVEPPAAPDADTVAYPVHADQFRAWLVRRQDGLLAPRPVASAPQAPAADEAAFAVRRFRLRRWPAPSLLQRDQSYVRMATLMSRNAFSVRQLAVLTTRPEADCQAFVLALHDAGLLKEHAPGDAPPAAAAPPPADAASPRLGLMASLRRHLGL
ncbi:hypothetical protein AB2N08_11765 [Massilia aurea]|uniref:hypothetical protein n=1 Tax=Massilia aurea TaxID=373040 RepID=UPI003461819D